MQSNRLNPESNSASVPALREWSAPVSGLSGWIATCGAMDPKPMMHGRSCTNGQSRSARSFFQRKANHIQRCLDRLFPRARELSASSGCHEAVTAVAVSGNLAGCTEQLCGQLLRPLPTVVHRLARVRAGKQSANSRIDWLDLM